jgi:hypothetical protein
MAEAERDKKNQELKVKKRDYTGYDDEEFAEGNLGMKRTVLSKYDEFLEGTREVVSSLLSNSPFAPWFLRRLAGLQIRRFRHLNQSKER